jgi:hypothetical protein
MKGVVYCVNIIPTERGRGVLCVVSKYFSSPGKKPQVYLLSQSWAKELAEASLEIQIKIQTAPADGARIS